MEFVTNTECSSFPLEPRDGGVLLGARGGGVLLGARDGGVLLGARDGGVLLGWASLLLPLISSINLWPLGICWLCGMSLGRSVDFLLSFSER